MNEIKPLPTALFSAHGVRSLDSIAINQVGIPGMTLMTRAGTAAFEAILARYPGVSCVQVFAGAGNNAGDGYIVAALAKRHGLEVDVVQIGDVTKLKGDAKTAFEQMVQAGVTPCQLDEFIHKPNAVMVDALLGIGLSGAVTGIWESAIATMNASPNDVVSVDIPSGLCADTGCVLGLAVRASLTITFIGVKVGLLTSAGPGHVGQLIFASLGVGKDVLQQVAPVATRLSHTHMKGWLPARSKSAHKGLFGHVLVVGGGPGMSGAVRLAGEAALLCGAGLVSVATHPDHATMVNTTRPELMCHSIKDKHVLAPLLARATVVALGPGLGQDDWAKAVFKTILAESKCPLVIDADALNLLSQQPQKFTHEVIITPHPGEAARLLNTSTQGVQADRLAAASKLFATFNATCILKGAGSLVSDSEPVPSLMHFAHPAVATAGLGDILTGVVAALVAQGLSPAKASRLACYVHAKASERAAKNLQRGLLASDVLTELKAVINQDWLC